MPVIEHRLRLGLLAWAAAGLAIGLTLLWLAPDAADSVFALATLPVLAVLLRDIASGLLRGNAGLDVLAALSMAGAMALGEELAAAVVALMFAGGSFLEDYARERARREMTALLARQPRRAARRGPARPGGGADRGDPPRRPPAHPPGRGGAGRWPRRLGPRRARHRGADRRAAAGGHRRRRAGAVSGPAMPARPSTLEAERAAGDSTWPASSAWCEQAQASRAPMARLADRWALLASSPSRC